MSENNPILPTTETTDYRLSSEQLAVWNSHVLEQFPREAVALIINGVVECVDNVHPVPETHWRVDPEVYIELTAGGGLEGILHSHTATPQQLGNHQWPLEWPSETDMRNWLATGAETRWGISACEGENVTAPIWLDENYRAPLLGRPFISGIWDCYSLVRDWYYQEKNILLPNYARGMFWWQNSDQNLYMDNFENAGFEEISEKNAEPGAVALMSFGSRGRVSHAAVLLDSETFIHHTQGSGLNGISCTVSRGRWQPFVRHWLRYKQDK